MVASPLLWVAWLLWQNEMLAASAEPGKYDIGSLQSLDSIPSLASKPLREVLTRNINNQEIDKALLLEVASKYRQRRPLDHQGWLWASELSQSSGNSAAAADYFSVAHSLSRNSSSMLMKVFNRYLELGLVDEAMLVAHDLVFAQPNKFRSLFYLLSRLSDNYPALVEKMIPSNVPAYGNYAPDQYYSWAIDDAIKAKNQELAHAIWVAIPAKFKRNSKYGLNYLNYLVSLQHWADVAPVWLEHVGNSIDAGEILTSDFESTINKNSPCWQSTNMPGVTWSIDSNSFTGKGGLMLEFDGNENVNYNHLFCHVAVESNQTYRLSGMWAGTGISTLSGPFVDVFFATDKGVNVRGEQMLGNWPWLKFGVNFTVPDNIEIITIRIRRIKTDLIDSKISGRVWFDDFKLEKLAAPVDFEQANERAVGL